MKFSDFFITHPRFATVIAIVMILLGAMAALVLPVSQYPQITPPQIVVSATYPGASAAVIMETVAVPIENEINGVENMLYMSSTCNDNGQYKLTITFNIGTNPDIAQVKVENRLQQVESILPDIVRQEGLEVSVQMSNILGMLALRSPNRTYSNLELSNYAYTTIENPLGRIYGVSDVSVYGPQYSMRIWLNPQKMALYGLSIADIKQAIQTQNVQAAVGSLSTAPSPQDTNLTLTLVTKGWLKSPAEFEEIILSTDKKGGVVRLKDVAEIEIGADTYQTTSSLNNQPSVIVGLSQLPGTNALSIMKNVRKEMQKLSEAFPEDMEFAVVYDSTAFVRTSIQSIIDTLILTFILVVGIVYLFLQNFRATLIPAITIPVSLMSAFMVIYLFGFDINILTLFALILAIGLVVDDAIVVVERVQYLMINKKMDSSAASAQAIKDIGGAVIATTLVLLSIFIPVGLMAGITGKIYQQFAVTIAAAVVFSSVNALTLSPALCSLFFKKKEDFTTPHSFFKWFDVTLNYSTDKYGKVVEFFCKRLKISTLVFLSVLGISVYFLLKIPTSFVPSEDQGVFMYNIQLPENASINRTQKIAADLADKIMQEKGVEYVINIAGYSMLGASGENIAMGVVVLENWAKRDGKELTSFAISNRLRALYGKNAYAGIDFFNIPAIPGIGSSDGISFQLNALNATTQADVLYLNLQKLLLALNENKKFAYAFSVFTPSSPHIYLEIDRTKLLSFGVSVSDLFSTLQANLGSSYINDITLLGKTNKVIIQADFDFRKNVENVGQLYVSSLEGKQYQIKEFLSEKTVLSPKILYRFNQYLTAAITAETAQGTSTGQAIETIKKEVSALEDKVDIAWTGLSLQEVETEGLAVILIVIAFVFCYLFLVALYESWLIAFAVVFSNIFAVLGAILGLYLFGLPLSIYAQLGLVLLVGLASKNAILIVEFILNYRHAGKDVVTASVLGARERFRAVLMTALTFVFGVLPMVFATGAGANSQIAIGVTVCFGMLLSTAVGILFIPSLYAVFDVLINRGKIPAPRKRRKK